MAVRCTSVFRCQLGQRSSVLQNFLKRFSNLQIVHVQIFYKISRFFPKVPCPPETMLPLGVELQTFDEKSRLSRPEIFESKNARPTLQTSPQSMHESIHDCTFKVPTLFQESI